MTTQPRPGIQNGIGERRQQSKKHFYMQQQQRIQHDQHRESYASMSIVYLSQAAVLQVTASLSRHIIKFERGVAKRRAAIPIAWLFPLCKALQQWLFIHSNSLSRRLSNHSFQHILQFVRDLLLWMILDKFGVRCLLAVEVSWFRHVVCSAHFLGLYLGLGRRVYL